MVTTTAAAMARPETKLHALDLGDLGQERLHRGADLGVVDAFVRLEHDVADLAGALPTEAVVEDVDAPACSPHPAA